MSGERGGKKRAGLFQELDWVLGRKLGWVVLGRVIGGSDQGLGQWVGF